jgi:hypothetical protein
MFSFAESRKLKKYGVIELCFVYSTLHLFYKKMMLQDYFKKKEGNEQPTLAFGSCLIM